MKTETITWNELPDDGLPDAEITVLAEVHQPGGGTEVWPAWWSGERWIDAGSGWPLEAGAVAAWADTPAGASAC